jgi:hypothetical protein
MEGIHSCEAESDLIKDSPHELCINYYTYLSEKLISELRMKIKRKFHQQFQLPFTSLSHLSLMIRSMVQQPMRSKCVVRKEERANVIKISWIYSSYRKDIQNEYRKNYKSAHHSEKESFGFEQQASKIDNKMWNGSAAHYDAAWYKEVVELRKKAGEYKVSFNCHHTAINELTSSLFLCTSESWLEW